MSGLGAPEKRSGEGWGQVDRTRPNILNVDIDLGYGTDVEIVGCLGNRAVLVGAEDSLVLYHVHKHGNLNAGTYLWNNIQEGDDIVDLNAGF